MRTYWAARKAGVDAGVGGGSGVGSDAVATCSFCARSFEPCLLRSPRRIKAFVQKEGDKAKKATVVADDLDGLVQPTGIKLHPPMPNLKNKYRPIFSPAC